MKNNLIGKRIAAAKTIDALMSFGGETCFLGETGEIVKINSGSPYKSIQVLFDGRNAPMKMYEDELYFPDSESGYNQKCFN